MSRKMEQENSLVFSYLTHRTVIGVMGTLLPFVLAAGALVFFGEGIRPSVSDYYHTPMRNVFVGMLFAIGFFLLSYRGYDMADKIAAPVACLAAVGVALFPVPPQDDPTVRPLHYIFATMFFLSLIYFSLFLFTKTDSAGDLPKRKRQRNLVYRACGHTMLACMVLVGVYAADPGGIRPSLARYDPIFWLEAIAIVAFGISWIVKGEALLKDEAAVPGS